MKREKQQARLRGETPNHDGHLSARTYQSSVPQRPAASHGPADYEADSICSIHIDLYSPEEYVRTWFRKIVWLKSALESLPVRRLPRSDLRH